MRTTIDIHEPLLGRATAWARKQGVRLDDVVNDALDEMFTRRAQPMPIRELGGRGLQPGIDLEDTEGLADVLEGIAERDSSTDI